MDTREKGKFAVIVPTRNRPQELKNLLISINSNSLLPDLLVIVDSSDTPSGTYMPCDYTDAHVIRTSIRSAAIQRNLGIQVVLEKKNKYKWVAFLDDDVLIEDNYFRLMDSYFLADSSIIGVSGITSPIEKKRRKIRKFFRILGIDGEPGSITKGVINISPAIIGSAAESEWLIGCSSWRLNILEKQLFETDFQGQSLFEDVIFSFRARSFGKLIVDDSIFLKHILSSIDRPNSFKHSYDWVVNRYRIFQYSRGEFSVRSYWLVNIFALCKFAIVGVFNLKREAIDSARGIVAGSLHLIRKVQ